MLGPTVQTARPAIDVSGGFSAYSATHGVVVGVFVIALWTLLALGCRWRHTPRERRLRRGVAAFNLAVQCASVVWYLWPTNFRLAESLPLHYCDVCGWIAFVAMFSAPRWASTLTIFWGISLCTQAFITPIVRVGPDHARFWLFWLTHAHIVAAAAYVAVVFRYRPRPFDLLFACGVLAVYGLGLIPLNLVLQTNYGFVGRSVPLAPTLVDHLGEWPLRLIWMGVIGWGAMIVLYLVLRFVRRSEEQESPRGT